jgi:curli biogenesis system outer membrane secretion channel CsgG/tetratricopeptide (TPR) repeat protein
VFGIAVTDPARGAGAAIESIEARSTAADAKLQPGDRLLRIDGKPPANAAEARRILHDAAISGRPLGLAVERDGWTRELTLSPRPAGAVATPPTTAVDAPPAGAATAPRGASPSGASLGAVMDEANRLYDARDWRGAEAAYQRAQDIVPDDARVWARLCHVRLMQQRFDAAVETCQRALQLDPKESGTLQNLGYSLSKLGRHAEALRAFTAAAELAPQWVAPYEGMAAVYVATGNWAQAEASCRRVLAIEPRNAVAWRTLADAAGEQGKGDEAIGAYRQALASGGRDAGTYRSLGWQLYRAGRHADAEVALLEADRLNPRDANALVLLGLAAEKLGRRDEARRAWQRASELDPAGATGNAARQNLAVFAGPDLHARPPVAPPSQREPSPAAAATAPAAPDERGARTPSRATLVPPAVPTALASSGAAAPSSGERLLARVAIGDFQVKAANAGQYVGDGLREMLLTALHNSGRFIVVERLDLKGLAAEQALSRSRMARPGEAIAEGQMEVADIMVYGAVTEFEPDRRGGGLSLGMPNVPLNLGLQGKSAHMAIDMRVVDVASSRVLATTRLAGEASSTQLSVGTTISARGTSFPATLGGFQNTPMEQAIRDCIDKATAYVATSTPPTYFRHR